MENQQQIFIEQDRFDPRYDDPFGVDPFAPRSFAPSSPTPFDNLQSLITKMGGIDGIVATVEKTQKLVQTLSPLLPLLGSLFVKKTTIVTPKKPIQRRKLGAAQKKRAIPKKRQIKDAIL